MSLGGAAALDPIEALDAVERAGIERVAVPGRWIEDDGAFDRTKQALGRFDVFEVADIAPSSVSGNIAGQSPSIVDSFVERMAEMIERAAALGARRVSLSLGEPEIPGESGGGRAKAAVLKRLGPYLVRRGIKLGVPLRIPRVGGGSSLEEWSALIRESMCPNIEIELRIHPHEPDGTKPPEGMAGHFLFNVGSVNFLFEPETGNSLSEKLLRGWFDALDAPTFDGDIIARPRPASIPMLESAIHALGKNFAIE